jgi:hypothetical protein
MKSFASYGIILHTVQYHTYRVLLYAENTEIDFPRNLLYLLRTVRTIQYDTKIQKKSRDEHAARGQTWSPTEPRF